MIRQLIAGLAVLACAGAVNARYNNKQAPITSLEDAAKMLDLSAAYSQDRDAAPAHLLLIKGFEIDGFEMQPMSWDASSSRAKKKGSKSSVLDSVGYYFKMVPTGRNYVTKDAFDDNWGYQLDQYSCIEDKNDTKAKLDMHALNTSNVDLSKSASSLTPKEAQEAIYQLSKGYRHVFMGDVEITLDGTKGVHPGSDLESWDGYLDYDNMPSDVIVNVCAGPNAGPGALYNGQWAVQTHNGNPAPLGNIYTWGPGEDYGAFGAFYAEWDSEADKKAALAGDVSKKAARVYIRGVQFSRLENPGEGTGLLHNAQSLLEYYNKAEIISDSQLADELAYLTDRKAGNSKPSAGSGSGELQVSCTLDADYESFVNNQFIESINVYVGDEERSNSRHTKWKDAYLVFRYQDGSEIRVTEPDYAFYYEYDALGKIQRMSLVEDKPSPTPNVPVWSVDGVVGGNSTVAHFTSTISQVFWTTDGTTKVDFCTYK